MAMPPLHGRLWSAAVNLLLVFLVGLAEAATAIDTIAQYQQRPQYEQVIVTFEQIGPCAAWMFPPEWEDILNDSLAPVGIQIQDKWTHGYSDHKLRRSRDLQASSGCPDWCVYLTQYCDCACVTNCKDSESESSEDEKDDEDDGKNGKMRYLLRHNTRGQDDLQWQAQEAFDNLQKQHSRRTMAKAQFIIDEETAQRYIKINLDHFGVNVECLNQNQALVYLI